MREQLEVEVPQMPKALLNAVADRAVDATLETIGLKPKSVGGEDKMTERHAEENDKDYDGLITAAFENDCDVDLLTSLETPDENGNIPNFKGTSEVWKLSEKTGDILIAYGPKNPKTWKKADFGALEKAVNAVGDVGGKAKKRQPRIIHCVWSEAEKRYKFYFGTLAKKLSKRSSFAETILGPLAEQLRNGSKAGMKAAELEDYCGSPKTNAYFFIIGFHV